MGEDYIVNARTTEIISELQIKLLQTTDRYEIYRIIPEKIREILGFGIVFTSILYEESQTFKIEAYAGMEMSFDKFIKAIGFDPLNIITPISAITPEELKLFRSGHLEKLEGGIYALGARRIPKPICKIIEKTLKVKDVYTMGFVSKNIHYGGLIIFSNRDLTPYKPLLEPIINQAAILVQRLWTEDELIKAKEKAEENDKLKTAFLQNMSHEIRTPINAICGFAELINDKNTPVETVREYTDIIYSSSLQLLDLINDVLSISFIETNQVTLNYSFINLNKMMEDLLEVYQAKLIGSGVLLKLLHENINKDIVIKSDELKLRQILTNLLNNALKFTSKGEISFGYTIKDELVEFYVKDSGVGIKKEAMDKIFERFQQEDTTTSSQYGGTGLGLTISKSYVEFLGGRIWLESKKNKGTIFRFTIKKGN
ncbi:sensor histidine kinase [Saccharicrinis sp. FJH54]|uniref:sensor histidine kinase n=1 Tax=Saccharicrinis sp. FJH54 TaxID=3344665 RepID=UPI0035D464AA